MINEELLNKLKIITNEERDLLKNKSVNTSIYTEKNGTIFMRKKVGNEGKLISIRPHTRFAHFPEHTHDYIEAVYTCNGKTTHVINGNKITLNAGELLFLGQNAKQEILPSGKNDIAVNFIISPPFFDKTLEILGSEETPIKIFILNSLLNKENKGYLLFKVANVMPVQNLIENLIFTITNDCTDAKVIAENTMALLILHLVSHTDKIFYETKEEEKLRETKLYHQMWEKTKVLPDYNTLRENGVPVSKMFLVSDHVDVLKEIKQELEKNKNLAVSSSFINNLEVTDVKAQKGPILKKYIESLGYTMEEVMVLGDSMNDLSMMDMDFGATIAMENAEEEIKKAAKYITKSNDEDGVAYVIDEMLKMYGYL